ncbi:VOC family protein [Ornithinimicrobium sp.]|uniref:VOC family protein n=1 Tax=Ornithinimicrobium sp. TaxID=1977084 RepID=UPI0034CD79F8
MSTVTVQERLGGLGASVQHRKPEGRATRVILGDPEGNEFCIAAHHELTSEIDQPRLIAQDPGPLLLPGLDVRPGVPRRDLGARPHRQPAVAGSPRESRRRMDPPNG